MDIQIEKFAGSGLYVYTNGRLDLDNSVEFGTKIKDAIEDSGHIKELVLDFMDISFISSFGLKVILELYKELSPNGKMRLVNVSDTVKNSFHMVGFDNFINIE